MSDIELAITRCRRLEQLLEQNLGAQGRGLHEKAGSVERRLPPAVLRQLRLVATVRNKVVHEEGPMRDRAGFLRAADQAEAALKAMGRPASSRSGLRPGLLVAVVLVLVLLAVVAWRVFGHYSGPR